MLVYSNSKLEKRMKDVNTASYEEPFIIENVVKDEIINEEVTHLIFHN